MPPPFDEGAPIDGEFIVNDEYLSLGVLFSSGGGGIVVADAPNAVSPPNAAGATAPGPVISYSDPIDAAFEIDGLPAWVDSVSITLTDTSCPSTLGAFDSFGNSLGIDVGDAGDTLTVAFPSQIHSVRIHQGPVGVDDFTFVNLVPEPVTLVLLASGTALIIGRKRRPAV